MGSTRSSRFVTDPDDPWYEPLSSLERRCPLKGHGIFLPVNGGLPVGDSVYVQGLDRFGTRVLVVCVDPRDGSPRWSSGISLEALSKGPAIGHDLDGVAIMLYGSLSYLVEVGTSFQPAFATTVTEEKRVWPLVLRFLQMKPAMRAHVRSLKGNAPLASSTGLGALGLSRGETMRGPAETGRLHLWVPPGKRSYTIAAPGHDSATFSLDATAYEAGAPKDLVLMPTLPATTLNAPPLLTW